MPTPAPAPKLQPFEVGVIPSKWRGPNAATTAASSAYADDGDDVDGSVGVGASRDLGTTLPSTDERSALGGVDYRAVVLDTMQVSRDATSVLPNSFDRGAFAEMEVIAQVGAVHAENGTVSVSRFSFAFLHVAHVSSRHVTSRHSPRHTRW
jgi:hypothetical protein